jgi:hypothetical protein
MPFWPLPESDLDFCAGMRNFWLRGKGLTQLQQLPKRSRRCSSRRFKATATTSRYFAFHVVLNGSQLDITISQGF